METPDMYIAIKDVEKDYFLVRIDRFERACAIVASLSFCVGIVATLIVIGGFQLLN